jgi:hypothetical protein
MKRFLLFAGPEYYPYGGWEDFKGDFALEEEAKLEAQRLCAIEECLYWWHIVDTQNPPRLDSFGLVEIPVKGEV